MLAYYRRDAGDPIDVSTRSRVDLDAFDAVAHEYVETLLGRIEEHRTAGGERHALTISLDGEYLSAPTHFYGRAILTVVYHTGPGMTIEAEDSIVGPYRLSSLSRLDALLNSLRDIPPHTMRRVLHTLHERTADEMGRDGLSYTVYWKLDQPLPHDLRAVLRVFGRPAGDEVGAAGGRRWNLFEPPDALAAGMDAILSGSAYRFVLEPLTGTIRFFYNSGT